MLRIEKGGKFYFDCSLVDSSRINIKDFILANLDIEVSLGKDLTLGELIHPFYEIKDFIFQYFSEEYEVVRAFSTIGKLNGNYKNLRIHKLLTIEDGYFYSVPSVELVTIKEEEKAIEKISDLLVVLDEDTILGMEEENNLKLKVKFSLLEVLSAIFEDFSYLLKNKSVVDS